ncbi:YceI family protein [Winogradskyella sp. PG-2]|uniref:YceI family protein n=1 Tax=Winogradskyella sp. PG-2 TaxID=754409 RepID=UPI0004588E6B|nr:YceI family protein [Winogradskyella sp. PG-2]BAO76052.1 rhodanese-like domain protein [Winogradskyella sp. PG-2]
MKIKYITTVITFCFISLYTFGQNKTVNIKKSKLSWTGKAAFNAYSLTGTLDVKSGDITIENDTIKSLRISINMKSLNHENKDLKKHLKGEDFFEVKTYNEATFQLSKGVALTDGKAKISGIMTIKDISKTESFTIKIDEDYKELTFNISIDRTIYGVKFNSPSFFKKMKENAIADEFKLKGSLILD